MTEYTQVQFVLFLMKQKEQNKKRKKAKKGEAKGEAKKEEKGIAESIALYRWYDAQGGKVTFHFLSFLSQQIEYDVSELQSPGEYGVRDAAVEGPARSRLENSLLNNWYKVRFLIFSSAKVF